MRRRAMTAPTTAVDLAWRDRTGARARAGYLSEAAPPIGTSAATTDTALLRNLGKTAIEPTEEFDDVRRALVAHG